MPTEKKIQNVERLRKLIEESVVAIAADHSQMKVSDMTNLRRALRESGVEFRVVKNRLTYLAADAAGRPLIKDVVQGPTGLAFGFDDPLAPAKVLTAFITSTRSPLKITGGVLGDRILSPAEIAELAALPGKEGLLSQLIGQLQSPATSLVYVLNAPISALARVLQGRIESMPAEEEPAAAAEPEATPPGSAEASVEAESAPETSEAPPPESPEESAEAEEPPIASEPEASAAESEDEAPTASEPEASTAESAEGSTEAEEAPTATEPEASASDSSEGSAEEEAPATSEASTPEFPEGSVKEDEPPADKQAD